MKNKKRTEKKQVNKQKKKKTNEYRDTIKVRMYECTYEGCDRVFDTEPKRRGHLSTHKPKKRAPGRRRRFVKRKKDDHPTRHGRVVAGLPPSHRRAPANNLTRYRRNAEPLFGADAINEARPIQNENIDEAPDQNEVGDQAPIQVGVADGIDVAEGHEETSAESESDLDSTIDSEEQYVDLRHLDIDVLECRLPDNRYIYAFPLDSTVQTIITLIKGIYENRKGRIFVLGGGHGLPTGDNWESSNDPANDMHKFPDQAIYDDIARGIQMIDEDSDARRITLLQLGKISVSQIDNIIITKGSTHVIFAYCDSVHDQLFRRHLERYRKTPPQPSCSKM